MSDQVNKTPSLPFWSMVYSIGERIDRSHLSMYEANQIRRLMNRRPKGSPTPREMAQVQGMWDRLND